MNYPIFTDKLISYAFWNFYAYPIFINTRK